ncbi:MAG: transposase [Bacteroidetes bacterium]|nr:MAG: transposase [Bacteroidota bacterium]MBZ0195487.1 transposase [Candidatus Kapabacteria bacterium]
MSEKRQRRHMSAEEKVKILREHLEKKRPISELCEQYGIDPGQFSQWKKAFFEGGVQVFATRAGRWLSRLKRKRCATGTLFLVLVAGEGSPERSDGLAVCCWKSLSVASKTAVREYSVRGMALVLNILS